MGFIDQLFDRIQLLLEESRDYRLRKRECVSCNRLTLLLENERRERAKLIELIRAPKEESVQEPEQTTIEYQPVVAQKSWVAKRYELEEADRQKAREQVAAQ